MKIGVIGAMHEEVELIINQMQQKNITEIGNRIFYEGNFFGLEIVVVFSRWGKVAAATTATTLLLKFHVDKIIFIGIAGAVVPGLNIGDIVIGERLFQHDMDARPFIRRYEIPLTGITSIATNKSEIKLATDAVHNFLKNEKEFRKELAEHNIVNPKLLIGDIASGDLFVAGAERKATINRNLPSVVCVEMEGAAVAQVCFDFGEPMIIIRTICDTADETSAEKFPYFKEHLAAKYSFFILKSLATLLTNN
ncbi:MAG: 5'-methylthioadenosine/adenosylhomocysteine nucleosidase [Paludibacteraceae bacterium]